MPSVSSLLLFLLVVSSCFVVPTTSARSRTGSLPLNNTFTQSHTTGVPLVISELGFGVRTSSRVTENTLQAFEKGIRRGAKCYEIRKEHMEEVLYMAEKKTKNIFMTLEDRW